MTIQEILNSSTHRPWPPPNGNWAFYQEWNQAVFLHWEVEFENLKNWVPEDLELDLFEGKPWVSVVAFTMQKIRHRTLPYFKPFSNFHEINIRTYVKVKNRPGVFFLSIEAGKWISAMISRSVSSFDYRFSGISRIENEYISANSKFGDSFKIEYKTGSEPAEKTALDKWLTERYAVYLKNAGSIRKFEVHHIEWPLQSIELEIVKINYPRFSDLINNNPDRVHYSKGVQVISWPKSGIIN